MSGWRVSDGQQITTACHPGGAAALLRTERSGVKSDKHWRMRVIYYTSIKRSANTPPAAEASLTRSGYVCMQLPNIKFHGCLALLISNTQSSLLLFSTIFFSRSGHNVLIREFRFFLFRLQKDKEKRSVVVSYPCNSQHVSNVCMCHLNLDAILEYIKI